MKKSFLCLFLFTAISIVAHAQNQKWKLVWADEFNYNGFPDSSKWGYETKGNSYGWGNNEKQFYTDHDTANAIVSNGLLTIKAVQATRKNKHYTSARLSTDGKFNFRYGKIEARIKLPAGKGTWAAFWMLGSNISSMKWPNCGEIDIMEHVGFDKDSVHGTVHTEAYNHIKGTQKGAAVLLTNPYNKFHLYAVEWTKENVSFLLDGKVYYTFSNEHRTNAEWPFDKPFYIILNLAIGGDWGGKMGIDNSIFPARMQVDYVRVYQSK